MKFVTNLGLGLVLLIALTAKVDAAILTVDNTGWSGATNDGWLGSGQSLTVQAGFERFDSIGFYFNDASIGQTFDFFLRSDPSDPTNVFSSQFIVQSGLNIINIDQNLAAGSTIFALLDYRGFSGKTVHYTDDTYDGGSSVFDDGSNYSSFTSLDLRFIAEFSSEQTAATPEPATLGIWGGISALGLIAGYRRKKALAAA